MAAPAPRPSPGAGQPWCPHARPGTSHPRARRETAAYEAMG